jgi:hypothetical protein
MRIAAVILLAFSFLGCAHSIRPSATSAAATEWQIGDFGVRFQPGPRGQEDRSYSSYQISYTAEGQEERHLVMESAHTLGGFGSVTNGGPKNWIRIVHDPSGRALLIEEEIPNVVPNNPSQLQSIEQLTTGATDAGALACLSFASEGLVAKLAF